MFLRKLVLFRYSSTIPECILMNHLFHPTQWFFFSNRKNHCENLFIKCEYLLLLLKQNHTKHLNLIFFESTVTFLNQIDFIILQLPRLQKKKIYQGYLIIHNFFLRHACCKHFSVNQKYNFVDSYTGCHTLSIEKMSGTENLRNKKQCSSLFKILSHTAHVATSFLKKTKTKYLFQC